MIDVDKLFQDGSYSFHFCNNYGRYQVNLLVSDICQAEYKYKYDYLWDISDLDEKLKTFFDKYISIRPVENVIFCISQPYQSNDTSFYLYELLVQINRLQDGEDSSSGRLATAYDDYLKNSPQFVPEHIELFEAFCKKYY